ncbi:uncharacterized protein V1518DRAFT_405343 [Limtongia smithiae]|uniref:uncharacterized protein n=1 Tax=Limtongia smithiae TaxID=1125753 RepID=UPI0034CD32B8
MCTSVLSTDDLVEFGYFFDPTFFTLPFHCQSIEQDYRSRLFFEAAGLPLSVISQEPCITCFQDRNSAVPFLQSESISFLPPSFTGKDDSHFVHMNDMLSPRYSRFPGTPFVGSPSACSDISATSADPSAYDSDKTSELEPGFCEYHDDCSCPGSRRMSTVTEGDAAALGTGPVVAATVTIEPHSSVLEPLSPASVPVSTGIRRNIPFAEVLRMPQYGPLGAGSFPAVIALALLSAPPHRNNTLKIDEIYRFISERFPECDMTGTPASLRWRSTVRSTLTSCTTFRNVEVYLSAAHGQDLAKINKSGLWTFSEEAWDQQTVLVKRRRKPRRVQRAKIEAKGDTAAPTETKT